MDSEHRHELEENWLAKKLAAAYEDVKPRLPSYGLALALVAVALVALNSYRSSAETANAGRWKDFAQALETGEPNQQMLKETAATHAGTPTGEWAEITWADGRLFGASSNFFRNRTESNQAAEEAVEVYQRLVTAGDRDIAERAGFQLARAYELQGKLDEAVAQYGRVTGAFAEVAVARATELEDEKVRASYSWISATKTAPSAEAAAGDATPDDLDLPDENLDDTLGSLLDQAGSEGETLLEEEAPADSAETETAEEAAEAAVEEGAAEATEESVEQGGEAVAEEAAETVTEATE